jgi:hypothetical protein
MSTKVTHGKVRCQNVVDRREEVKRRNFGAWDVENSVRVQSIVMKREKTVRLLKEGAGTATQKCH